MSKLKIGSVEKNVTANNKSPILLLIDEEYDKLKDKMRISTAIASLSS